MHSNNMYKDIKIDKLNEFVCARNFVLNFFKACQPKF